MDQQQILIIAAVVVVTAFVITRRVRGMARRKLVAEKLSDGAKIVDVRTPSEFGGGHYPGAVNVPLDKLSGRMKKLGGKDSSIVVYCATGSRSRAAVSQMRAAGFSDVVNGGSLAHLPR